MVYPQRISVTELVAGRTCSGASHSDSTHGGGGEKESEDMHKQTKLAQEKNDFVQDNKASVNVEESGRWQTTATSSANGSEEAVSSVAEPQRDEQPPQLNVVDSPRSADLVASLREDSIKNAAQ